MTPHQITLVRQSFAKVVPIRETAAALFYDRLFTIDPSTRPLFRGDLAAQGMKLMTAIATIVRSLDRIEPMLDDIRALARRHVGYGSGRRTTPASARPFSGRSSRDSAPTSRTRSGTRGPPPTAC